MQGLVWREVCQNFGTSPKNFTLCQNFGSERFFLVWSLKKIFRQHFVTARLDKSPLKQDQYVGAASRKGLDPDRFPNKSLETW
jgi:hypothetical protein